MTRRQLPNGMIFGYRHGEWWIGARHNPQCDWWEIGLLGLTLIVPHESLQPAYRHMTHRPAGSPSRHGGY